MDSGSEVFYSDDSYYGGSPDVSDNDTNAFSDLFYKNSSDESYRNGDSLLGETSGSDWDAESNLETESGSEIVVGGESSDDQAGVEFQKEYDKKLLKYFLKNLLIEHELICLNDAEASQKLEDSERLFYKTKHKYAKTKRKICLAIYFCVARKTYRRAKQKEKRVSDRVKEKYDKALDIQRFSEWTYCCMDVTPASHKVGCGNPHVEKLFNDIDDYQDKRYIRRIVEKSRPGGILEDALVSLIYKRLEKKGEKNALPRARFWLNQFPDVRKSIFGNLYSSEKFNTFLHALKREDYTCEYAGECYNGRGADLFDDNLLPDGTKKVLKSLKSGGLEKRIEKMKYMRWMKKSGGKKKKKIYPKITIS